MTAWSGDPIPEDMVREQHPAQLQGAVVFQNKNCRNCHALEGSGGQRGPDLTAVGTRLTRDQLIDQVSNGTPGGGNMPAYGKQISPAEMTALVDFLASLRPPGQPPAEPAYARTAEKAIAMNPTLDAFLRSWPFDPWLARRARPDRPASTCAAGWFSIAATRSAGTRGRLAAFLGGLAAIFLALASPIEPFAALLLQVHMVQHLLLMMVAPPLLWLGAPLFPLLRGLPQPIRTYWVAPLLSLAAAAPALRAADAPGGGAAALRRRHLAVARSRRSTNWPCARAAGTTSSTPASSARACCSGIRSSGPIPAGRAGRPGCCSRT